jgi:hypothetical protein
VATNSTFDVAKHFRCFAITQPFRRRLFAVWAVVQYQVIPRGMRGTLTDAGAIFIPVPRFSSAGYCSSNPSYSLPPLSYTVVCTRQFVLIALVFIEA